MLNCPFSPDNPYSLDEIARDGQNNMKRICDLDSCNGEMITESRKGGTRVANWQLFENIE